MGTPYLGEIRMFAGNFAPVGWSFCDGTPLAISEYDALFNLIGTTYGGDGQNTFNLPDLRGRVSVHQGTGASGTPYTLGEAAGVETVTLTTSQIPVHTHSLTATEAAADQLTPLNNMPAEATKRFYITPGATAAMAAGALGSDGGSQPHDNFQPYLCVAFIIALFGVYPSPT